MLLHDLLDFILTHLFLYCIEGEGHSAYLAVDFLQHATDVLIFLSLSPNQRIAKGAKSILKDCVDEINDCQLRPQENYIPDRMSPIYTGDMKINDTSTFDLEFYTQYPSPWLAIMHDTTHYLGSQP